MATSDPLAALRDIHAPPPPEGLSVLPLVAGGCAAVLLLILSVWLVLRLRRRWASELVRGLDRLNDASADVTLSEAAGLLRRVAVLKLGDAAYRLQGQAWLASLDKLFRTTFFSTGAGQVLGDALYRQPPENFQVRPIVAELRRLARQRERTPW